MSSFDVASHPRGQVANAGQCHCKVNDVPDSELTADDDELHPGSWMILADRLRDFSKAVEKENRRHVDGRRWARLLLEIDGLPDHAG